MSVDREGVDDDGADYVDVSGEGVHTGLLIAG